MKRGGGSFVLTHYAELEPGEFGKRLAPGDRYCFTSKKKLASDLSTAMEQKVANIALDGPVVNPDSSHAESLVQVFGDLPDEVTIAFGRWLPTGPRTSSIIPLLRRFDELEIDYQSAGRRARPHYRVRHPHRSYAATMTWLRKHSIEPTVSICVGIPGDDQFALVETLRCVYSLRPARVQLHMLCVPPGSYFDRHRDRFRLASEPDPPYRVTSHSTAGRLEMKWMTRICRKSIAGYRRWRKISSGNSL
jgi:hypothetical protein